MVHKKEREFYFKNKIENLYERGIKNIQPYDDGTSCYYRNYNDKI